MPGLLPDGWYSGAAKMADYVDAAVMELDRFAMQVEPVTIFFGGGTPSLLPAALMRRLLEAVGGRASRGAVREWTIECNPATVSADKAKLFRDFGINRISMGVQSLDEALLAAYRRESRLIKKTKRLLPM